jgi:hypothetical protein
MAYKTKVKVEEELCEGCDNPETTPVTEAKTMKPISKAARAQVQDEYDMEKEEKGCSMEEASEEDEKDMEDSEEEDSTADDAEDAAEDETDSEEDDMKESFNEMFSGQELTEEFKLKVSTLFEAAVNNRVSIVEERLANKFTELLESEVEDIANDLTEKVDSYLNYVVNEWMEENKLAVERGIRTDVAESFISGLKNLFNEHNIAVPEGQTDLLDETANNLQKVTEQLNVQMKKTIELTEELKKYQRAEIFAETTDGLSSAQVEKLRGLAEGMKFSDNSEFKAKLNILKENFSKATAKPTVSSIQVEEIEEPKTLNESTAPDVSAYLKAMTRKIK